MDNIDIKKNIENIMMEVSNRNKPSIANKINKKYYTLNDIILKYKNFINKINILEDVSTWGESLLEHESYDRADTILEKIKNDLIKGFSSVPYKLYSIEINYKEDYVLIRYIDDLEKVRDFKINDFTSKVKKGFKVTDFNLIREPLDFSKVLETIMTDINGYWIKNILNFIDEAKKVDELNVIIDTMNKKAQSKNNLIMAKYIDLFDKLKEVKVIFPIKLFNGETLIPSDIDSLNNYKLYSSEGELLLKIINSNKIDKILLFDKCKIDEESIPTWLNNDNLFQKFENIEKDYNSIINEFNAFKNKFKSIEPYKNIFKEPVEEKNIFK